MTGVKEGRKYQKKFKVGETEYSHFFVEHSPPPGSLAPRQLRDEDYLDASVAVFKDEEETRERFYYPYLNREKTKWILDIGAQFGSYTLPALAAGYKVLAFSPETEVEGLDLNIITNRFKECHVMRTGLYDRAGFFDTITNTFHEAKEHERFIMAGPLDSFLYSFNTVPVGYIHYMKIDAEGAELPILKGATETIKKNKPYLLVENHLMYNKAIEGELISYIDSLGLGYKHETVPYHAISHTFFDPNP